MAKIPRAFEFGPVARQAGMHPLLRRQALVHAALCRPFCVGDDPQLGNR